VTLLQAPLLLQAAAVAPLLQALLPVEVPAAAQAVVALQAAAVLQLQAAAVALLLQLLPEVPAAVQAMLLAALPAALAAAFPAAEAATWLPASTLAELCLEAAASRSSALAARRIARQRLRLKLQQYLLATSPG
jgi:ABC-type transporter Mla MlaB component